MCPTLPIVTLSVLVTSMAGCWKSAGIVTSVVHYTQSAWHYTRTCRLRRRSARRSKLVSVQSTLGLIAEAKGQLYVLLEEPGEPSGEYGDCLYRAVELLTEAAQEIERAQ